MGKETYWYNDHKAKLLHIMLPKTSTHLKRHGGQSRWMCVLIEDDDSLG